MSADVSSKAKLKSRAEALSELNRAVQDGATLRWGDGVRAQKLRLLRDLGVELVTKTSATKHGHVIKQRQTPVANAYYGAPLQRYADLYVLGLQTRPAS